MSNNQIFALLTGLRKNGVQIHLTEDGWREFIRIIEEDNTEAEGQSNQAV